MSIPKIWRRIPENYNLRGKQCSECSALIFPASEVCNCGSLKLDDYDFKGAGEIISYTVIRTPILAPDMTIEIPSRVVPYILALIKLDEGPLLTSEIVDCNSSEVEIGKRVKVVFRKILERGKKGVIQYGYKFKLD